LLQRAALILVLAASTALYTYALHQSPVYMSGDEVHFANGGLAIAQHGRSLNGERFPLFVNLHDPLGDPVKMPWGDTWFHPILFYLIALSLKVQSFSEVAVRMPTAVIGGLLTPLLVYLAARRMHFEFAGALAAAILASLTPVSFILSREAVDYSLLVPRRLSRDPAREIGGARGRDSRHWLLLLYCGVGVVTVPARDLVAGVLAVGARLAARGARFRPGIRAGPHRGDGVAVRASNGTA
jgi:4-amino-4-deoxy-L-arabinose transferase-like glycosyltransferase